MDKDLEIHAPSTGNKIGIYSHLNEFGHVRKDGRKSRARHDVEIQFIKKADGSNPHQYLTHVGGVRPDGKRWQLTEDEVMQSMKHDILFHVNIGGKKVRVIVASYSDRKYLKTEVDRDRPSKLLNLPEL